MRALVFDKTLRFDPAHAEPVRADGECLIRVHLAGICSTDLQLVRGYMGFSGVLGHEFVGTVIEGTDAWRGKRVVGEINCVCRKCDMCQAGLSNHCRRRTVLGILGRNGCFADLVALPEHNLHAVPDAITDEEAVFAEPLAAAFQVAKQVKLEPRLRVAVVGSGRLGLLVAQVLNTFGCRVEVIGRNPMSLAIAEKRHVATAQVRDTALVNDRDVVIDCTGEPEGLQVALGLVRPRGTIVLKSTYAEAGQVDLAPAVVNEVSIIGSRCGPFGEALDALARRKIDVAPLISRSVRLERGVEAFAAAADPAHVKVLLKVSAA
jgi:alcohol dehydrogenase